MKKYVLAMLCSVALIPAANAADLGPAVKAPVLAPAPFTWTGFYIGGNAGWGRGDVKSSNLTTTTDGTLFGNPGFLGGPVTFTNADRNFDLGHDGFNGGGQIGYNWQIDKAVLGIEADFQWSGFKGTDVFQPTIDSPIATTDSKVDWYSTVRARLGYAFGQFMPYVTGGLAVAHSSANLTLQPVAPAPVLTPFAASVTKTHVGYAVGGGVEFALNQNWSIKGEYLHLGLGNESYDFDFGSAGSVHSDSKLSLDIARLGVNYRF